jgi:hypothetical protein
VRFRRLTRAHDSLYPPEVPSVPSVAVPDGELFSPLGTPAYTTRSFYSR